MSPSSKISQRNPTISELPEFIFDRVFDAPRDLVWKAWTDPELLHKWYGPGADTIIHKFDLEPGGEWLNEMKWGDNSMYQKVVFQTVTPTTEMVWHHYSSTDSNWVSSPNPQMPDWPALLLTTVTFETVGDKTNVRLSQIPHDASDAELACFAKVMGNMSKGWGAGYEILDKVLADLRVA
ncbi:MAG: SRPBCC domain-containing protein [Maricaulis sp.]|nr:SRPBCC domain-containing protein [Maricaulis sp.]